jgi:hypothetical protein
MALLNGSARHAPEKPLTRYGMGEEVPASATRAPIAQ